MSSFVEKSHRDAKREKERHFVFPVPTLFSANKAMFDFHESIFSAKPWIKGVGDRLANKFQCCLLMAEVLLELSI